MRERCSRCTCHKQRSYYRVVLSRWLRSAGSTIEEEVRQGDVVRYGTGCMRQMVRERHNRW
jgi:hypothetical protein